MRIKQTITFNRNEVKAVEKLREKARRVFNYPKLVEDEMSYIDIKSKSKLQSMLYRLRLSDEIQLEIDLELDDSIFESYVDILEDVLDLAPAAMKIGQKAGRFQEGLEEDAAEAEIEIDTDAT